MSGSFRKSTSSGTSSSPLPATKSNARAGRGIAVCNLPGTKSRAVAETTLLPHLAWLTQETLERSLVAALDNVERLKAGRSFAIAS